MLLEGRETYARFLVLLTLAHVHRDAAGMQAGAQGALELKGEVEEAMLRLCEELVELSHGRELQAVNYLPFSLTHRIKIRLWQAYVHLCGITCMGVGRER